MLERRGGLDGLELGDIASAAARGADLRLCELRPAAALVIAGWDDAVSEQVRAAMAALGLAVGELPGPANAASDARSLMAWLGPRRWLAITQSEDAAARLAAAVATECRIDWNGARSWLRLSGAAAQALLAGEMPVDIRPAAFPDGAATQTVLSQVDVLVHARARDPVPEFDLLVGRSFAAHFARDLAHAAAIQGLDFRVAPEGCDDAAPAGATNGAGI